MGGGGSELASGGGGGGVNPPVNPSMVMLGYEMLQLL